MHRRSKILVVDDSPINIEIIDEALGETYDVKPAATGAEALELIGDCRPDVVLLDIMMPGIDGYEVCRRIRADPAFRHTKVIMVSAKAMTSERLEAYEAGADDYLTKPVDMDELLSKVQVFLKLKSVEEMDQLKGDLLSLLSHECRTPLNGIIGPLEILMSEENLDSITQKELVKIAHGSAHRMQDFLAKIVALSAMKSGKWGFQLAPANVYDVLRDALGEVTARARERNIDILEEISSKPTISLDRKEMKKVLVALLDNAIRFSHPDGEIKVRIASDGEGVHLTVTDHGEGIDPDFLPRVFDEFTGADIKHHSKGHGLSLAIARQIMTQHDGHITVQSTKGAETTFTVRLPLRMQAEEASAPEAEGAGTSHSTSG